MTGLLEIGIYIRGNGKSSVKVNKSTTILKRAYNCIRGEIWEMVGKIEGRGSMDIVNYSIVSRVEIINGNQRPSDIRSIRSI